jgi:hypothetical protein
MTATYFRALAARCRTVSRDSLDLFAKEQFRQLATEFNAKVDQLDLSVEASWTGRVVGLLMVEPQGSERHRARA